MSLAISGARAITASDVPDGDLDAGNAAAGPIGRPTGAVAFVPKPMPDGPIGGADVGVTDEFGSGVVTGGVATEAGGAIVPGALVEVAAGVCTSGDGAC